MAFQAVASKVNSMAERLAYVEGRLEGKKPKAAEKAIKEKVKPIKRTGGGGGGGSTEVSSTKAKGKGMTKARPPIDDRVAKVTSMGVQQMPAISVDAYDLLPEDLDELIEIDEEMAQEQYQDAP